MNGLFRILSLWLAAALLISAFFPGGKVDAQTGSDPAARAQALVNSLTPEERVGQLFLVTFTGTDVSAESQIYDLIVNHKVSGVVLSAGNDNFGETDNTVQNAQLLINQLQQLGWEGAQQNGHYVPLWIGLSQEGDGAPQDQIINGLSKLPSEMMLGASWNTSLAEQVGKVMGSELNALGVNLYIGPSLDVITSPSTGVDDLGVRSFGGDPYWVGKLGQAYISGLHTGSNNQMIVISKHFPGRGSSDRSLDNEVGTVRKSLEQLKQIELAPFIAVTSGGNTGSVTDGLLVSHLRYQGFQGNIRATTRPVSLDSTALSQIMALESFKTWRDAGGLMVSDNLGSTAIRRFADSTMQSFDQRQVARSAFLAGNDLLYVDNFAGSGEKDSYSGVVATLEFFLIRYNQDPAFAERVDQSVLRILTAKFKAYPTFGINQVRKSESALGGIGKVSGLDYTVAQEAATLIDPTQAELASVITDAPQREERIVFLTDTIKIRQCSTCNEVSSPAVDAMQKAVISGYGPLAGNQVVSSRLKSYSFQSVLDWLNDTDPPVDLATDVNQANWLVVLTQDLDSSRPASYAFKRILAEKPDVLRDKKVVVFAMGAPNYLDSTDIARITAYYGLFGKSQSNLNVAALVLFQEMTPHGSSPVSISGVGYDLINATSPDPQQVINLMLDLPEATLPTLSVTDLTITPNPIPEYKIGDTLPMRTGVILDQNGHQVPDGTVVRFLITTGAEVSSTQQIDATTVDGVARASFRISSPGLHQVGVVAEPAQTSDILQLDVQPDAAAIVIAVTPTPEVSVTPNVTPTQDLTPTPTLTPAPDPSAGLPVFADWIMAMVVIILGCGLAYNFGLRLRSARWGIRWALCSALGGLLSYIYLAGRLPGSTSWLTLTGTAGMVGVTLLFTAFGWAVGILWYAIPGKDQH